MKEYNDTLRIQELLEMRVGVLCEIELAIGVDQKAMWQNELKKIYNELNELGWRRQA